MKPASSIWIAFLAVACSGGSAEKPTASAPASGDDPRAAELAACLDAMERDGGGAAHFAGCIGPLHAARGCRAAWTASRAALTIGEYSRIAEACAADYCPQLSEPRPHLCRGEVSGYGDSPVLVLHLAELESVVLARDAGLASRPDLLGRVAAALVAHLAVKAQRPREVELPKSAETEAGATAVVAVAATGEITVDGRAVSMDELRAWLAEKGRSEAEVGLVIRAEEGVEHARVIAVMDAAKAAGIERLMLATGGE